MSQKRPRPLAGFQTSGGNRQVRTGEEDFLPSLWTRVPPQGSALEWLRAVLAVLNVLIWGVVAWFWS